MKILSKKTWTACLLVLSTAVGLFHACKKPGGMLDEQVVLPFQGVDSIQVEAVLEGLTLEEKIGQLIIWRPDLKDSMAFEQLYQGTTAGRVGGVLLKNIDVRDYLFIADSLHRSVKLPLFFATDEKVSLLNQFAGLRKFPLPATIATIDSSGLQQTLERLYTLQCKALGINFSLNPTLKTGRSELDTFDYQTYESDKKTLTLRSQRVAQRLSRNRIFSAADDFSEFIFVENDTLRDSLAAHFLTHTKAGLTGLKIANSIFLHDTLEQERRGFVRNYLRNYLHFNGLMIADIGPDESPEEKLSEGVELFLTTDARHTFEALRQLADSGIFTMQEIDQRVRKVLKAKAWINGGRLPVEMTVFPIDTVRRQRVRLVAVAEKTPAVILHKYVPRREGFEERAEEIACYFEDPKWDFFIKFLFESSVIVARDQQGILPFKNIYHANFQVIGYGQQPYHVFSNYFSKYANAEYRHAPVPVSGELAPLMSKRADDSSTTVILLDRVDLKSGFHKSFIESVDALARHSKVVIVNFGNPVNLKHFTPSVTCVQIFERNEVTEHYAAQVLFGGSIASGILPVQVSENLPYGASNRHTPVRLGFVAPEKTGILQERLVGINAIAESAIDKGVFPGCQVVIAKDGQVIFSQAFGNHTYDKKKKTPVSTTDLFDIASVTKVAATTMAIMKLTEQKQIELKSTLGDYLKLDSRATVKNIKIKDLLLHNSGLQAQMPLAKYFNYKNVPAKGCNDYFCRSRRGRYDVKVADGLYLRHDHQDTIMQRVYHLPVTKPRFQYSDVNYFLLQKLVEEKTGLPLDRYVFENIYRPLGLRYTTYNPLEKFSKSVIVPAENDRFWRKTLIQGTVHDPAAALMGGVGGNAGVFANAEDLAVLFQMLLDEGQYGGEQFFDAETVRSFTESKYGNHRGLGFDKPAGRRYPTYSKYSSPKSYGHTGFTGTCVWVDPEEKLVYVFLSNRVYPSARNGKIFSEATRSRIHEVVYNALDTFRPELPVLAGEEIIED